MGLELKALKERRAAVAKQMRGMVEKAEQEDRGLNTEERESWDNMNVEVEGLESRIQIAERASELGDFSDIEDDHIPPNNPGIQPHANRGNGPSEDDLRAQAFWAMVRSNEPGLSGLSQEHRSLLASMRERETRAQGVSADSAGGYTVPQGFQSQIFEAMKAYGGIRNVATVLTTDTGNDLPFITDDDTANIGAILAENTPDTEQDVTFGQVMLGAYKYTSRIVRVSVELLQDNAVNLEAYLSRIFARRLGRATAAHYAAGTGTGQPRGLMVAATVGHTAASNAAITYPELIDLKHSVDPAYRNGARWAFNDSTLKALKKLVDADGRPLWSPAISSDSPATLDGDQYIIDQGIAPIGSNARSIAYGDLTNYHIRDVRAMTLVRLVERYADYHQVGFIAFMRSDADLIDAGLGPVKVLAHPV